MTQEKSQLERFKDAARELECDDDEARFDATVKKVAKAISRSDKAKSKADG